MATQNGNAVRTTESGVVGDLPKGRIWDEFAIRAFAVIVARKHNIAVPLDDVPSLSNEELAQRLRLVSDLAHLPPA